MNPNSQCIFCGSQGPCGFCSPTRADDLPPFGEDPQPSTSRQRSQSLSSPEVPGDRPAKRPRIKSEPSTSSPEEAERPSAASRFTLAIETELVRARALQNRLAGFNHGLFWESLVNQQPFNGEFTAQELQQRFALLMKFEEWRIVFRDFVRSGPLRAPPVVPARFRFVRGNYRRGSF